MKISKIITSILLFIMIFMCISCGNEKPGKVVENYFSNVQDDDSMFQNVIKDLISNSDYNKDIPAETYDKIVSKIKEMKFTVNSEEINGNTATVNITVEGMNLSDVIENVVKDTFKESFNRAVEGEQMTEKETEEYIYNSLGKYMDESEDAVRSGDVTLTKEKGKWQINKDENFIKLILGIDEQKIKDSIKSDSIDVNK